MTIGLDGAGSRAALGALLAVCLATLAACGKMSAAGEGQVVASVGGDEITETQVSHVVERQPGLKPDQVDGASRKAVSGLVEQTIVLQKAQELKLDRDERVMQNIEAMKRELIVNAYVARIADGAAKASEKEIQAYYDDNPALFRQRRVYVFQELAIDGTPEQLKTIETDLAQTKSAAEISDYVKAKQLSVHSKQTTLAAENVPQQLLKRVANLKNGQGVMVANDGGLRILMLAGYQESPVAEDKARPMIAAYLAALAKRQAVQKELASLQSGAKVAYFGKYADMAASAPAATSSAVALAAPAASTNVK